MNRLSSEENENTESVIPDFSSKILESSALKTFFQRIFSNLFHSNRILEEKNPKNRIQKIIPKLNNVLSDLKNIENKIDKNDSALIAFIVDPLIKQGEMLKSQIISSPNHLKSHLISQYVQWIDRAFKWINVVEFQNKSQLLHFVSKYIYNETLEIIKKDIAFVIEYQEQKLEKLDISEEETKKVKEKISILLDPIFYKFNSIQEILSEVLTIEHLNLWKEEVNLARQFFLDQSLSIIDDTISIEFPLRKYKGGNDYLVDILSQIVELEKDMTLLIEDMNHFDESKAAKYYILDKANLLHKEARELSTDIRLSQEFYERLQRIIVQIDEIYVSLKQKNF